MPKDTAQDILQHQPQRTLAFLRYVLDHRDNPAGTAWGKYRCFDGYALAAYALEETSVGEYLLTQTLDMIDANFAEEDADPKAKWHLADFAIHPLLRAYLRYGPCTDRPGTPHDELPGPWSRLIRTAMGFRLHYGDLSENHNLLHLALRYLLGQYWPDATLIDGRPASAHRDEARDAILLWLRTWTREGSTEWGSGIYYNVNLLALYNLVDFADEPAVAGPARDVLDLFLLDEALHAYAGAMLGGAHRDYAVYRMDATESPSRALHHILFGTTREPVFNLNFIGGVLQAACSDHRPPEAVVRIGMGDLPHETTTTHPLDKGLWNRDAKDPTPAQSEDNHLSSHAFRLPSGMLGAMNSYGSRGRYTEFVWQATLDEQAIVFVNHPSANVPHALIEAGELVARYDADDPPAVDIARQDPPWYWHYANVPPGNDGDVRPGYWQGNIDGPRCVGLGPVAAAVYDLRPDVSMPFIHLYFPKRCFDEVEQRGGWLLARRGKGYVGVWTSPGGAWGEQGTWAGVEYRVPGPRCATLVRIGDTTTHADFASFSGDAEAMSVSWEEADRCLHWSQPGQAQRVRLDYVLGPLAGDQRIETRSARFQTPWGCLDVDQPRAAFDVGGIAWDLDLSWAHT